MEFSSLAEEAEMKKLIVFFSASGVTEKAALQLAKAAGGESYRIKPIHPYTKEDLDWRNKSSRSSIEMQDPSSRPEIEKDWPDVKSYDVIYIGFPIWWGVAPRPVNTFIESQDFSGKKIVLFATSGGSRIDYAVNEMKKHYPELQIIASAMLKGEVSSDII